MVANMKYFFEKTLPFVVIQLKYIWIAFLGISVVASAIVIFYEPGLRLPEQEQFQLFKRDHVFEK